MVLERSCGLGRRNLASVQGGPMSEADQQTWGLGFSESLGLACGGPTEASNLETKVLGARKGMERKAVKYQSPKRQAGEPSGNGIVGEKSEKTDL